MDVCQRNPDVAKVVEYNHLERKKNDKMFLTWKSYPGIANIITKARNMTETGQMVCIKRLLELMQ